MTTRLLLPLIVVPLMGCPPTRGGDDDDATPSIDWFDLDRDGDGQLTADDAEPGEALALLTLPERISEQDTPVVVDNSYLYESGGGSWQVQLSWTDDTGYWGLSVYFQSSPGWPEVGVGEVTSANVFQKTSGGVSASVQSPDAEVEIVSVDGESAFGQLSGDLSMDVIDWATEEPTGEVVDVRGLAFGSYVSVPLGR